MLARKIEEFNKMEFKVCLGTYGCNTNKPVEAFSKRGPYGYNTICKDCMGKYKQSRKNQPIVANTDIAV